MITFVRHAQSLFNSTGQIYRDIHLSELGKQQAMNLDGNYDVCIVSPLQRAKDTLNLSKIKYKVLEISHLCREHKDGNIINLLVDEKESIESLDELCERVLKFKQLLYNYIKDGHKICVISHYSFLLALTGIPFDNAQQISMIHKL
jgi:bisphosphoglycerate-dependent phosphoglycerate mutase